MKDRFVYGIILLVSILVVGIFSGCGGCGCGSCLGSCGSCLGNCAGCVGSCGVNAVEGCWSCTAEPLIDGCIDGCNNW